MREERGLEIDKLFKSYNYLKKSTHKRKFTGQIKWILD